MDKIILGIGNPGKKYHGTRHNLGFAVVDKMAELLGENFQSSRFQALVADTTISGSRVLLIKPLTYVNLSGNCAQAALQWYKLEASDLLVITDDLSLPTGKLRFRARGSSGGHRGLDSIIRSLGGNDFPRLRIGIGNDFYGSAANYVLSTFAGEDREAITESIAHAAQAAEVWVRDGIGRAMNLYNAKKDNAEKAPEN